jgi:hypothetical protein
MLGTIWQDLRYGTRMLAKNPGFSLVAILSIAIGVGANAAMFSVADGLMLRPLPISDPDGLLTVSATLPTGEIRSGGNSYPDYADLRDRAQSFESLAAVDGVSVAFARRRDESARGTFGLAVSANFFDVLRIRPLLGRTFLPDEDRPRGSRFARGLCQCGGPAHEPRAGAGARDRDATGHRWQSRSIDATTDH